MKKLIESPGLLILSAFIAGLVLAIFVVVMSPAPSVVKVGTIEPEMHSGGKLCLVGKAGGETFPMWVLNYSESGEPMWGYIKLKHVGQAEYVAEKFGLTFVHSGNFLDPSYVQGFPHIYDAGAKKKVWYDPASMGGPIDKEPSDFLVVVWLDKGRYPSAPGHSAEN